MSIHIPLPRFPERHSENLEWMNEARCLDMNPELFFPRKPAGTKMSAGAQFIIRNACDHCPVAEECLRYAIDIQATAGVWGGKEFGRRGRGSRNAHDDDDF